MLTNATGHAKSDRPQLIEKIKVLKLIEQQMNHQNQQAQKLLNKGLIEDDDNWLEDEEPSDNAHEAVTYAAIASIITELKTLYNKITKL